jgi:tetratricopeptide (TPR) repeat protein
MPDSIRLATALADRYQIERELGQGGMATVYLAQDLRHDRKVALKVIRPESAVALGPERFLREIQVTAQLDHPHIVALLDSGEAEGLLYYVMPYVEGESLRQRLDRETQLPLEDAIQIARQVADALGHAHDRGVIHRDIKPENILLAGGHARVADFGIARAVTAAGGQRLTVTGMAVGTPAYMSPEQGGGRGELDGRSDIYSLGCVLYEMLAGHPPFTGTTVQEILARQSLDAVPSLSAARSSVPAPIEEAVLKALEKSPADRFTTAAEFSAAIALDAVGYRRRVPARLRRRVLGLGLGILALLGVMAGVRWAWQAWGARVGVNPNVVVVLPFRVTAPDTLSNYLREGIVDLLNGWLTGDGVPRALDSRTTLSAWRRAVAAAGGELSAGQALALAQRLGAGQILLGEVVLTPNRTTISARLLRVPDGAVRAEGSEVGSGDELELIQRLVVRILAQAAEGTTRVGATSDSLSALRAYLIGVQAERRGQIEKAVGQYEWAIAIDSTFALAALRLALVRIEAPCEDGFDCLGKAELRAWSLRDRLGPGDRAQLRTLFTIGPNYPDPPTMADLVGAAEEAAAANPDRAEAWLRLGTWLLVWGRSAGVAGWLPQAVSALDSAITLDTTAVALNMRLEAAIIVGDPDEIRRVAGSYVRHAGLGYVWNRWLVARALNDSVALPQLRGWLAQIDPSDLQFMVAYLLRFRYPLDDAEHAVSARLGVHRALPEWECTRLMRLMEISILRGRAGRAIVLADSASHVKGCDSQGPTAPQAILTAALVESGYETAAGQHARQLDVQADTAGVADPACYAELWRVSQGDTSRTRRRVSRIRQLVRALGPGPLARVGRLEVCPLLLEAALEWMQIEPNHSPAIDRLESVMRRGTGFELPGNVANLMLARWRARQGDYPSARAVAWGPPSHITPPFYILVPAYRREEGRLAAALGDTAGAIRAYQHYLALRSDPDPGPKTSEVDSVKAHLAQLVRARR